MKHPAELIGNKVAHICTDWNAKHAELCAQPATWRIDFRIERTTHTMLYRCNKHAKRFKTLHKYVIDMVELT